MLSMETEGESEMQSWRSHVGHFESSYSETKSLVVKKI